MKKENKGANVKMMSVPDGCESRRNRMEVGRVLGSFILKSAQQEEALHHICF
ncbi:unnamed protein product [Spirodela intermedia]|uniref:Uncharacterized protein n=1 Tax=Spirodela intermedia TaxID=51605 RepID=A0A7I8KYJ1_SPIIN|nr:unnamed protein product [Spirodela intermedia]